ncbi:excinuclease ABC subunit UvrA [Marichromatium gracile]|uniref:UvrABC system protein A n=1 Tax=Marichromatium gracile TaxID=1048 RepID=A0A4V2WAA2_MARGR|nr:excinuclease ABC subunit UvrA [Marichromatium gracile]MBK1708311.1 excinuclease ABC subunit A [Marichromatium gracile]MBO8085383.1 excinuclease ABC subunit UvrA [Marichromatium sp.]TCW38560.1 excinuclease ABC subunit A [Marichromatium gracile]
MDTIRIRGARTHNLKGIDLDLPRERLIVFTGLSGSGKSSLAFDTLYAEGQRRYVESLSAYARQFLSVMDKPDVDHIEGLSPAISIEQKTTSHNPRSTVGTITEIYDYLRLLFARAGEPRCPTHGVALAAQTVSQMVDQVLARPEGERLMLLAPVVRNRKGDHQRLLGELHAQGFVRALIDGAIHELDALPALDAKRRHDIALVVDRFRVRADLASRLAESFETALALTEGVASLVALDAPNQPLLTFSANFACPHCGYSITELEPRAFSFNNPAGACPECDGLGIEQFFDPDKVVIHPELSLAGGAVRGWDRRNAYYFGLIRALGAHYGFDVETPWRELPETVRERVLFGSGEERIRVRLPNERGPGRERPFEGVIRNMERRYRETESNTVREELARYLSHQPCPACQGSRLNQAARHVFLGEYNLPALTALPVGESLRFFEGLRLAGARGEIGAKVIDEIATRLRFLVDVGLDYLTLERSADTLSGGEAQRIRLASQIGAGLVGVLYILDEPSIGLHQRDNARLLRTLTHLRDLGNTVIVVEHDEDAIRAADQVVDLGPGAGTHGGRVIAQGSAAEIADDPASLTGRYLSGAERIAIPTQRHPPDPERQLRILGARGNNLRAVDVAIPVGTLCCVTGVSGSGKSTLINDTLYPVAARHFNGASLRPRPHGAIEGLEHFDKVIDIDQSPIGRTPRSNPATYTGLFNMVRELFASVPEARARGYGPGRFSFNVKGGRCEACKGDGLIRVEMHFLPDVYVQCDTCQGRRYNRETLEIRYKGKRIDEVLDLTIAEALEFFAAIPLIQRRLQTLVDVGLAYVRLGQSATTLSGGEAQRVKLSRELAKRGSGRTLYILDEPTTGLHFHDVRQLLEVLHRLRDQGNTVVVIEHNLDVIKTADWIIDLGPEGGDKGGEIVATGTPEAIAAEPRSHTGRFLAPLLARGW